MLPSASVGERARFATVLPAVKLMLEATGRVWLHGYTVTYPPVSGCVTVMFTTATVPPAKPVGKEVTVPAPGFPLAVRVSPTLVGAVVVMLAVSAAWSQMRCVAAVV